MSYCGSVVERFSFMPNIIRILRSWSMKIFSTFPTINISKLNYWLLICIAKNFIWTTLKMIFSIFRFFCSLRFQIYKYCPIITNHTSMEIWFIQLSDDAQILIIIKKTLMTGFELQGHICVLIHFIQWYKKKIIISSIFKYTILYHIHSLMKSCWSYTICLVYEIMIIVEWLILNALLS